MNSPIRKFGRFYNNSKEYCERYLELFICLAKGVYKQLVIYSSSLWKGRARRPAEIGKWKVEYFQEKLSSDNSITWIGHSSFLIHLENKNILTDPIFGSPSFLFPRIIKPGIFFNQLPKIDYVLLSHNHWDHMSPKCLRQIYELFPSVLFLIPQGDGRWFKKWALPFREFSWGDSFVSNSLKLTFLTSHHWSQRSVFDQNKSLWGSWMIEGFEKKIYFGGDTAYGDHFKAIAKKFYNIDIALLPVGPCEPRRWMRKSHMNSEDAVQAFQDLQAKAFIPMHWGTFHFGTDNFDTPIKLLKSVWPKNLDLRVLKIGETYTDFSLPKILRSKGAESST